MVATNKNYSCHKQPDNVTQISVSSQSGVTVETLLNCECLMKLDYPLTRAEYEVATGFVTGLSYKEIANQRCVSTQTIKSQVASVLSKTRRTRRVERN